MRSQRNHSRVIESCDVKTHDRLHRTPFHGASPHAPQPAHPSSPFRPISNPDYCPAQEETNSGSLQDLEAPSSSQCQASPSQALSPPSSSRRGSAEQGGWLPAFDRMSVVMSARYRYCPAHLEHPSVKVADRLQDSPCAQVSLRLQRACDEEVYDDRVREVLPVAASDGREGRLCAGNEGAGRAHRGDCGLGPQMLRRGI